jgi:hypothetical protein
MASAAQAVIQKLETRNQTPEKIKREQPRRPPGFCFLVSSFCFLVSGFGCVHLPKTGSDDPMPHGAVCQIATSWNHQVVFAPDPTHNGTPTPGLAGRLYLFGPEISFPLVEEGSLIVDLFDDTKPAADAKPTGDGQSLPLEEWRLDPATLKRLVKKDMIGYGYTLFLPWGTYKPEVNQIHMKVRFLTAKGGSFYSESGRLSLDKGIEPVTHSATEMAKANPPLDSTASKPDAAQSASANVANGGLRAN